MQYIVLSGHIDAPIDEHQIAAGPFLSADEARAAAEQEAQIQRLRYAAMSANTTATVEVAAEPADDVLFVLVDGLPRWRIAAALQLRLFGAGDLLDELARDIDIDRSQLDAPQLDEKF